MIQNRHFAEPSIGSRDNRSDYDGKTVFQEQRATLWGNFTRRLSWTKPVKMVFSILIHHNGVMYIPCSTSEESNLELIVRVMDYDFGKRDDLLGEILLDVGALVQRKDRQSFPLKRNGKDEKGEVTLSAKFVPYGSMFPDQSSTGQRVSAIAKKPLCLVLTVHQATGLRKADWIGKNDVYVQAYRVPEEGISPGKKLPAPDIRTKLPDGETIFPFAFSLRTDAPGSAELGVADYAYIRYDVYANVDFSRWRDPSRRVTISVIPNRPVPTPKLLAPAMVKHDDLIIYTFSCCCKCGAHPGVSTTFGIDRRAYASGETIRIHESSKVVNDSSETLILSKSI